MVKSVVEFERSPAVTPRKFSLGRQPLKNRVEESQRIRYSLKGVTPAFEGVSHLHCSHRLSRRLIDYCADKVSPRDFGSQMLTERVLESDFSSSQLGDFCVQQVAPGSLSSNLRPDLEERFLEFIRHGYS